MAKEAASKQSSIHPETPEMEALLGSGYGMTVKEAESIIKERTANPLAYTYEVFKNAQAFLEAYHSTPRAIDTSPAWHRRKRGTEE